MRKYSRILARLHSTASILRGPSVEPSHIRYLAREIALATDIGVQLAVALSTGQPSRFVPQWGIRKSDSATILDLASVFQSLVLRSVLSMSTDRNVRVITSQAVWSATDPYTRLLARSHLDKGNILIFADDTDGGLQIDLKCVEKALEMGAKSLVIGYMDSAWTNKAGFGGVRDTLVNGHTMGDYETLHYEDARLAPSSLWNNEALEQLQQHDISVHLFNVDEPGSLRRICEGLPTGVEISSAGTRMRVPT